MIEIILLKIINSFTIEYIFGFLLFFIDNDIIV